MEAGREKLEDLEELWAGGAPCLLLNKCQRERRSEKAQRRGRTVKGNY